MKEKQTVPEKTIVIDIKLTKGLVVALSCVLTVVALLAYLTLTGAPAEAAETETAQAASTGMRQFYLTKGAYPGNAAKTACAVGYHMASLWEIADPSNLKYNTSLGQIAADSGQGPPSDIVMWGWVRTGYSSNKSDTPGPGNANCTVWDDTSGFGTVVDLHDDWKSGGQDMGVWDAALAGCYDTRAVWCVED